jgi:hypothetical protein
MLNINKFTHKSFYVDAVKVTDDNMVEAARWCGGSIHSDDKGTYIAVPVANAQNPRQGRAYTDDHLLRMNGKFKVFLPKQFANSFQPVGEQPCGSRETPDKEPCILGRGHRATAVFVACRSATDYKVLGQGSGPQGIKAVLASMNAPAVEKPEHAVIQPDPEHAVVEKLVEV